MALEFPLDDKQQYPGRISFQILEFDGAKLPPAEAQKLQEAFAGFGQDGPDVANRESVEEGVLGQLQVFAEQAKKSAQNAAQTAKAITNLVATNLEFTPGEGWIPLPEDEGGGVIKLYLAPGISFTDAVELDTHNFGAGKGALLNKIEEGGSSANPITLKDAFTNIGLSSVSGIVDAAKNNPQEAFRAASVQIARMSRRFGGDGVANSADYISQGTVNPNKRVMFKEVKVREFSFNFKFLPTSPEEAKSVRKIIMKFRENMYPERLLEGSDIPFAYKFPRLFQISYTHRDSPVGFKMLRSYLDNMQITINPNSMGFFEDGQPTETDVTLNFREYRALDKSDIQKGY